MKRVLRRYALAISFALLPSLVPAQWPSPETSEKQDEDRDVRLPNGKSQKEEILKADHEKNLKDAAQLAQMAEDLKQELEKNDVHVLSVSSIKKTEEIERIAKRIRSRLRRF